ncbi:MULTISPECIES: DUF6049 family protein [Prauserella salsuginis group]|uniref:Glycoprotein n=2 Tax=Prauserella salsuginis group TaxID=2893672 RepID=A0A839XPZ4_9PSEU|nr:MULTISPECIES: DUF6049 family protein [Prauserella salsuginis group]MBB3662743.1 hypothetical protein [Prauserella sediminis]MCR3720440.1 hypothetical protein [Prauserella flava]MCR3733850.1 hypothetical protein [Prauserella salsuginis]
MKRFSAFALALAFLLTQGLSAPAATAAATTALGAADRAAHLQPAQAQPSPEQRLSAPDLLELDIDTFSPRILTAGEADRTRVQVTGTVTNTGDRDISDVVARLQVGQTVPTTSAFQQAVSEPPPADAGTTEWVTLTDALAPGESAPVRFDVPAADLPLATPGIYPLLVNVNGTPAYGGPARLASMNLLMPVIDPPSEAAPARTTLLWPITATRPRVVSQPHDDTIMLADDGLATALAPGGRLDALVESALAKQENSALFGSMCFAIDPELLDTVEAMTDGYRVRTTDGHVEGQGAQDARNWLDKLRSLVASHCVIQLPYADADLGTLAEVDSETDLTSMAVGGGPSILQRTGVQPRQGVVWPAHALDKDAMSAATAAGARTFLVPPAASTSADAIGRVSTAGQARTLTYDPLVSAALTGRKARGNRLTAVNDTEVATQNGIAALALRGGLGEQTGGPLVIAPPRRINATTGELTAFLDAYAQLQQANMLTPTPLDEVLATPPQGAAPAREPGDGSAAAALDADLLNSLSGTEATTAELNRAMRVDPARQVPPAELLRPLHNAVIRATSSAWSARPATAMAAARSAEAQLDDLTGHVTVATLAQPVLRGSESAPLPVSVSNDLPVQIRVRLQLENIAGLRPAHIPVQTLSANSTFSPQVPAETLRSGRFKITVSLTTPGGANLGEPAELELSSTELSTVTLVITIVAGVALVLLSGRRIIRRIRHTGDGEPTS